MELDVQTLLTIRGEGGIATCMHIGHVAPWPKAAL